MAKSPEEVLELLHRLLKLTKPIAHNEYQEIGWFAHDEEGITFNYGIYLPFTLKI